jgi:tripartite ATP-independent transporter DctP family solute receptor
MKRTDRKSNVFRKSGGRHLSASGASTSFADNGAGRDFRRTRRLFICALVSFLLALCGNVNAAPAPLTSLTLGHNAPLGGPQDIAARAFVAQIARALPQHFSIDVRGGLTVGNDGVIYQAVRLGAIDIAICGTSSFSDHIPALGVLDLPFLFRDRTHAAHVLDGPIGTELGAAFAPVGLINLAFGELGIRQLTNSRRPIRVPSDLDGLHLRVAPNDIYSLTFKTLGAEVVTMGIGEVYAGLRDGRIDGQENPLLVIQANHFADVQKYLSLSEHVYAATAVFMNAGVFAELTPDEQAVLRQAALAAAAASRVAGALSLRQAIEELAGSGIQITANFDRDAFVRALAPILPEFDRRFGADLIARIRATP